LSTCFFCPIPEGSGKVIVGPGGREATLGHSELVRLIQAEALRLVGEKIVEFQEDCLIHWLGKPWKRRGKRRASILCPRCSQSSGFRRRGAKKRVFRTYCGRAESALLQITCSCCQHTFSPFASLFTPRGKLYTDDPVGSLVVSTALVLYRELEEGRGWEESTEIAKATAGQEIQHFFGLSLRAKGAIPTQRLAS
jgi:hypothetical protein